MTGAVAIRARNDETCVLSGDGRVTCWARASGNWAAEAIQVA